MNKTINDNKLTLADTILSVLDKPLQYHEIAKLCVAAGYKTRARDFGNLVFMSLSKMEKENKVQRFVDNDLLKWSKK